ncbi:MAG: hypothetical protein JO142_21340 [Burkholderiales bacterium]|nr:hypothetical protein [Burkholderiales bacterium]
MNCDELIAAARENSRQQMARPISEEERLTMAFLEGAAAGGAMVHAQVVGRLVVMKAKIPLAD